MFSFRDFLIISGIVLIICGSSDSLNFITSGEGGEQCGSEGLRCLERQAKCQSNKCVCTKRRHPYGKGMLNCFRKSEFYTEIVNDPMVTTLNPNDAYSFSLPCRFLISHFTTGLENRKKKNIGGCEFKVHGFQQKDKGKLYLGGVDLAIKINYKNGNSYHASLRNFGKADNGTYNYTVLATSGSFLPDGPWGNDVISYYDHANYVRMNSFVDEDNNILQLSVKKCGMRFRFRAYDCELRRNQTFLPGLSLTVSRAFPPVVFLSDSQVMSMIPMEKSNGITVRTSLEGLLDRQQSMVYRALMSGITQNQPETNNECAASAPILGACANDQEVKDAFDNCFWMLKTPRFIRCYDETKSGEKIMGLFNSCLSMFCGSTTCQSVIDSITTAKCDKVPRIPVLDSFVAGTMCP